MKLPKLESMSPLMRRRFLKILGATVAAPAVSPAVRFAANEMVGGKAHAQAMEDARGTLFIEVNLRDQWDQGHVFVAPGLATHTGLRRGENGDRAALFFTQDELQQAADRVFLTADSIALAPHLDSVAMIDCCEPSLGRIHGHEAANPLRSPGRDYAAGNGRMPMYDNDPVSNFPQGCEEFYSRVPTPASLHNHHQKTLDPSLRNGIAFKGISRALHTAYHFGAGLDGAELDRVRSKDQLFGMFPEFVENLNVVASPEEADAITRLLGRADANFLRRRAFGAGAGSRHQSNLDEAREILYVQEPRLVRVPLDEAEEAFWGADVPGQMCTRSDTESVECGGDSVKAQIWEQFAYAYKLLWSGMTRTVALEFDYMDLHGFRPEIAVRTQAKQLSIPLARLIQSLKDAGLYERTLIAVYTTDGSRSPAADSYGNTGKNTLILAGGMIRGGYYGDISVSRDTGDGHEYAYHAPDPATGLPMEGRTGTSGRVSSAAVWRTVMKALRVPDAVASQFPDVADARTLDYLLRA